MSPLGTKRVGHVRRIHRDCGDLRSVPLAWQKTVSGPEFIFYFAAKIENNNFQMVQNFD